MHRMNHEAILLFDDGLIYASPAGRATLPAGEHEAYGLFGRDVLLAEGGNIRRWSLSEGMAGLISGPDDVRIGLLTGADVTGVVAFTVGEQVLTASTRHRDKGADVQPLAQFPEPIAALAVAPAAPVIAVAVGRRIDVFNLAAAAPIMSFYGSAPIQALSFCPMGYGLAGITSDDRLSVWSLMDGSLQCSHDVPPGLVGLALHDYGPLDVEVLHVDGSHDRLSWPSSSSGENTSPR